MIKNYKFGNIIFLYNLKLKVIKTNNIQPHKQSPKNERIKQSIKSITSELWGKTSPCPEALRDQRPIKQWKH